jgi:hypothetical protein
VEKSQSNTPSHLVRYEAARSALAEACRVDEVKDIHDKAVAMQVYARQAKDRALIDHATEIRLRAERRAGELLRDMAQAGERAVRKNMKSQPATSKLSDLNINKSQSSRWQKLADVSTNDFEDLVTKAQQKACAAVDRAQQPKPKPPKPKAKPEPKPKPRRKQPGGNGADVAAACIAEVAAIVSIAIPKISAGARSAFLDELRRTVRTIVAEATARDADTNHWEETTH